MATNGEIKNVVFDLGGVVIDLARENAVTELEKIGLKEAGELLGLYRQEEPFLGLETGNSTAAEVFDRLRSMCLPGTTDTDIARAFEAFLVRIPKERLEALRRLRSSGYKVYALSNTNPVMFHGWINREFRQEGHHVRDYFDGIVVSFEEGTCKPDTAIFKTVLDRYGLNGKETLMLDDSEANCRAAEEAGMTAFRIDNTQAGKDMISVVERLTSPAPTVATAGTFDGVHRGHMAVLSELISTAKNDGLHPLAITFDRHPLEVVAPHRAPRLLIGEERQRELIEASGASLLRIPFDKQTAAMTAREWMRQLRDKCGVSTLVMGYDNTFGHDGVNMSISDYIELGREEGIMVKEAPLIPGISSSEIRKAVTSGNVVAAHEMLGRPYELDGVVVKGKSLGRELGFPTANLETHPIRLVPGEGVYAAVAITPDGERHPAMVNIGHRPTVDSDSRLTIEAHIIDWTGDLYTKPLTLLFLSRLRDERHFDSLDELKGQLSSDAEATKRLFEKHQQV